MNNRIPQSFIQDLLSRTDIIEIITARLPLTKRGNNYVGLCPFHQEKTPSFTVSPTKQFYYCFGCGAHGNAINFLTQYDRLEFIDTIRYLATQLGLELPDTTQSSSKSFEHYYDVLKRVNEYYQNALRENQMAIDYLKSRKISGETAKKYAIGYAKAKWNDLETVFNHKPEAISSLMTNGLLSPRKNQQNEYYDRFRNRIMFPIYDIRGRIIGFGGRTLTEELPKYMNSPETPIFHKSNELYGLYQARLVESTLKQVVVVEGYMDVIALAQYGIHYAVATLGTAVSRYHIQKILRYTSTLTFCFDGDNAGQQAAWKALLLSLPLLRDGIHIRFLFLPNGEDPDSLVHKIGKRAFEEKITKAHSLETVFFTKLQREISINNLDGKAHFARKAMDLLKEMPDGLYRKLMIKRIAEILRVNVEDLQSLADTSTPARNTAPKQQTNILKTLTPALLAIALMLRQPSLATSVKNIDLLAAYSTPERDLFLRLSEVLKAAPEQSLGQILAEWQEPQECQLMAQLGARSLPYDTENYAAEFTDALDRLEQQATQYLTQQLIDKAKNHELSDSEKQKLCSLLANKNRQELD